MSNNDSETDSTASSGDEIIPTTKKAKMTTTNPITSISNISSKILPSVLLFYKKKYENFYSKHLNKQKNKFSSIPSPTTSSYLSKHQQSAHNISQTTTKNLEKSYLDLPIYKYKEEILTYLKSSYFLVISAETGSGKTTQLPKFFLSSLSNSKQIACTQPRRVAAISVAKRVSEELNEALGNTVGYCVRFDTNVSKSTKLKYMTDGYLLKEGTDDPLYSKYSFIILDEIHEKTIYSEVLMAFLKKAVNARKNTDNELKVILCSASLNEDKLAKYFNCEAIKVLGRCYRVSVKYSRQQIIDYVEKSIQTALNCVIKCLEEINDQNNTILCILTGKEEILYACDVLNDKLKSFLEEEFDPYILNTNNNKDYDNIIVNNTYSKSFKTSNKQANNIHIEILPFFGSLSLLEQQRVFNNNKTLTFKVIFSTNLAETSLTIPNVTTVIDSCFCKDNYFDPESRINKLLLYPLTKEALLQRTGRAGRVKEGVCYRLITKEIYKYDLEKETKPNILKESLDSLVILLKYQNIEINELDWLEKPSAKQIESSNKYLNLIGLLEDNKLTKLGKLVARLPLEPSMGKFLIQSVINGVEEEALCVVSMMETFKHIENIEPDKQDSFEGDIFMLINLYKLYIKNKWKKRKRMPRCLQGVNRKDLEKAELIYKQLKLSIERIKERNEIDFGDRKIERLLMGKCAKGKINVLLLNSFPLNLAKKVKNGYEIIWNNLEARIHPSSILYRKQPKHVLFGSSFCTNNIYLQFCNILSKDSILEITKGLYEKETVYKDLENSLKN